MTRSDLPVPHNRPAATRPLYAPDDLGRFVGIFGAAFVPDSDAVVYVANTRDGEHTCDQALLWHTEGGEVGLLAESQGSQRCPAISARGELAFLQVAAGRRWVVSRPLRGGETTVLTDFERGAGPVGPQWSPDGRALAFDACDAPVRDPKLPYRVVDPVWRAEGDGLVADARTDVFVIPEPGAAARRLTFDDGIVYLHAWSPDGASILYGVIAQPGSREYELKIVDVRDGSTRTVASGRFLARGFHALAAWLPDGRIAYSSTWEMNRQIHLLVIDPRTGEREVRTTGIQGQLFGALPSDFNVEALAPRIVVDPQGDAAYVPIQRRGSMAIYRVALTGDIAIEPLTSEDSSSVPVAVSGRRLLTVKTSLVAPPDLHVVDLESGRGDQLTKLNAGWLDELPFDVHHLEFQSQDGTAELEGWYLAPRSAEPPHPTVLHIHGGPFAAHGQAFSVDNLLFTAAGYGVLKLNYRGSSGYGDDFSPLLLSELVRHDTADLVQGVDEAARRGLADPARVASFGLSFGGYLTTWLLTHTDRFRAGIAECPATEWFSKVGCDMPEVVTAWVGRPAGHGVDAAREYLEVSSTTFAAQCSAPLLLVEHEADLRTPAMQGEALYNALLLAGKEAEMLRLPGIGHNPFGADVRVRVARAEALLEWLDRHAR
jgi:dipeptidyl aminopeptidase/acylaminoacyl peptidase